MNIQYLKRTRWWQGVAGIFLLTSGVGIGAFIHLTRSPDVANCQSSSQLQDAAGAIIYCATTIADEQDSGKLSQAIRLVNSIPKDNPLRESADKLVEKWSQALLSLGEQRFDEGDLNQAIKIVEAIPNHLPLYESAKKQTEEWKDIWLRAERIYQTVKAKIDRQNQGRIWYAAFNEAKQLKSLNNQYWASIKYQELLHSIQSAKEERERENNENKLAKAETTTNSNNSPAFDSRQRTEDEAQLEKARTLASSGKIDDMRSALIEASMVISDEHHQEAEKLIQNLENKIATSEDSNYLENAKKFALKNDTISLEMAINEVNLIGKERPLYKQANQQMALWKQKKSVLEAQENRLLAVSNSNNSKKISNINPVITTIKKSNPVTAKVQVSKQLPQREKPVVMDKLPSLTEVKINETRTDFVRLEELENKQIQE
ncbi:hypothetical protein [Brunnivagina elsteri]|uniref:Chromosome segregation ATPase n=1 Tax=Brunnivagina elsteri CCALA 953 TaxID=987040 RepID=A0A2A2TDU0_9CYAN|nr:hypothetical protein [Calothrix elsteri]PAX51920.1 hypothetical protein CK510_22135 [Calothrix elsteri CCALA 953]